MRNNIPELRVVDSDFPTDDVRTHIYLLVQSLIHFCVGFLHFYLHFSILLITSTVRHFGEIVSTARAWGLPLQLRVRNNLYHYEFQRCVSISLTLSESELSSRQFISMCEWQCECPKHHCTKKITSQLNITPGFFFCFIISKKGFISVHLAHNIDKSSDQFVFCHLASHY